ncbi:FMN-dependent NADH-azoreductase [Furfurilactobacillus entadae]|uniref:FMN-dependent NADH-azoreductase n=1 Tax=Furfurilactobacillus entadae TaxID=2922307 RepID=UPI0035EBCE2B
MKKMLVIEAHPQTQTDSKSLTVGQAFIEAYQTAHPDDLVTIHDLYTEGVPPINNQTFDAWKQLKYGKPLSALPIELQTMMKRHQEEIDEFVDYDRYVFINPMYNHFLPAEMKQYIDVISVAHKTFAYTPAGPKGLLHDKKMVHIQSAGGVYHGTGAQDHATFDFGDAYLMHTMKFFGVDDVRGLYVEGADADPDHADQIIANAVKQAQTMATTF